jgi:hypothetical protein
MKRPKTRQRINIPEPVRHPALESALSEIVSRDTALSHAVREAAHAFRGTELRRAADRGATTALLDWILSDAPFGRGERILLAELMAGEIGTNGRPRIKAAAAQAYRAVIALARQHKRNQIEAGEHHPIEAAETAAELVRGMKASRGKSSKTIQRDMQRKISKVR